MLNLDFLNSPNKDTEVFGNDIMNAAQPGDCFDMFAMYNTQPEEPSSWEVQEMHFVSKPQQTLSKNNNNAQFKFQLSSYSVGPTENNQFDNYNKSHDPKHQNSNYSQFAENRMDSYADLENVQSLSNVGDLTSKCTSMKKFTCRFEIQIPNEPQFRVARKIIGFKGGNMKRIIDTCKARDPHNKNGVKLRLRGKGSGFKEGPNHKESDDDLHLCVSSQFLEFGNLDMMSALPFYRENIYAAHDVFQFACESVEKLLLKIYKEYRTFMQEKHNSFVKIDIKKIENSPAIMINQMEFCPPYLAN
jgi:hypothetical protein